MIFDSSKPGLEAASDLYCNRYRSKEAAIAGHAEAVDYAKTLEV